MKIAERQHGFTLVELIVVLFMLAVFAAIAIPGFTQLINNSRTQGVGNEIQGLLQYARGYAVENRTNASVCSGEGQLSIRTTCDAGGTVLRVLEAPQGVALSAELDDLQFRSNGSASASASYTTCHDEDFAQGFTISVELSGQVRIYPRGQKSGGVAMDKCDL